MQPSGSPYRRLSFWFPFFLVAISGLWGIRWGLPSEARRDLFLNPRLKTPEFYQRVEKARDDMYSKIGGDIVAYFGRTNTQEQGNTYVTILNSYSSYLVKTHSMDEAATLVMVSHLNPLHNQWYPHSFVYGGAYLFPLAASLGIAHVLHIIRLVPSAMYYFIHPDEIAKIYLFIRILSLVGLLVAFTAVFDLSLALVGAPLAPWAALFFGLAPVCLASAKFAKPHIWAASLSLWAIVFCVRAKKAGHPKRAIASACLLMGLSMGMTMTQVVFLPFVVWAAWSEDRRKAIQQSVLALALIGLVFLATNFYMVAHWRDYLAEQIFLKRFSPFGFNGVALWKFIVEVLRTSLGWELWVLACLGWGWAFSQKSYTRLQQISWILMGVVVYVAFQTQAQAGMFSTSRLFLPMIALLSIFAGAVTFQWGQVGRAIRWLCLIVLLVKAGVYDAHFHSDRVPLDNASLAAHWVTDHVPLKSLIAQSSLVPHVDFFPPIDFSQYRIVQIGGKELEQDHGPAYALVSAKELEAREHLLQGGFHLLQKFNESPLQKLGFDDPFTNANFPVEIYGRGVETIPGAGIPRKS